MNNTIFSNQVFNIGDYVRTSKGNIGIITEPSCIKVGYLKNEVQNFLPEFVCLEKFHLGQDLEAEESVEKWSWSYPLNMIEKQICSNQVKLGNKIFPINSDKLIKLERLRIKTHQGFSIHEIELPVSDAKILMDIYNRNKIWYAIISR